MRWGFEHMQADQGGSVYLRLSTRTLDQPPRDMTAELRRDVLAGAYWQAAPAPGSKLAIVYSGVVAPEAIDAHGQILDDVPDAALLAVPSPDRMHADWVATKRQRALGGASPSAHIESLLGPLAPDAGVDHGDRWSPGGAIVAGFGGGPPGATRSESIVSANPATSRISIVTTASTATRYSMPARPPAWAASRPPDTPACAITQRPRGAGTPRCSGKAAYSIWSRRRGYSMLTWWCALRGRGGIGRHARFRVW